MEAYLDVLQQLTFHSDDNDDPDKNKEPRND
jgi:hypothetical protein